MDKDALLYNIYDALVREANRDSETGIKVSGVSINMDRYADDKVVVSNSKRGFQPIMDNLNTKIWQENKCEGN